MHCSSIKSRRSVRKFKQRMPSDQDIIKIISAGNEAPSARNEQKWQFLVIKDKQTLQEIKAIVDAKIQDIKEFVLEEYKEKFGSYSKRFFYDTPVYIIPIYNTASFLGDFLDSSITTEKAKEYAQLGQDKDEKCSLISASFAVENMLLTIDELGLGAVFVGGALLAENEIKQLLDVPDGWKIQGLIPVGYPDETPESPEKKPVDMFIKWV